MKNVKNSKEAGKELTQASRSLILGDRKKITAVKRRVHLQVRYRELRQVKGSTGKEMEDGLGASHRLGIILHRLRWERPLQRQGIRKIPVPAEVFAARQR